MARRLRRHLPQLFLLASGIAGGLWWALPVRLGGGVSSCGSGAGEGHVYCLIQHAWAPAFTRLTLCVAAAWVLGDWLFVRRPERRAGRARRPARAGHGREAVAGDGVLRAASWGVLPPPTRPVAVAPITVAAIAGGAEVIALRPAALRPSPRLLVRTGRVPGRDASDPALIAACWSVVSRASIRFIDGAAVQLGLATDRPRALVGGAADPSPEPLLLAATFGAGRSATVVPLRPLTPSRVGTAPRRAWGRRRIADPVERAAVRLSRLAALGAGLLWALPLRDVTASCPPRGEGYGMCALQTSWLPAGIEVVALVVAARLLTWTAFHVVPAMRERWRSGRRPTRMTRAQAAPPYAEDPVLLAASWGVRTGREDERRAS